MTTPHADEDAETLDHSYRAEGNIKWSSLRNSLAGSFSQRCACLAITLLGQRNENLGSRKNLHMDCHSSSIPDRQKLEATQTPLNW